MTTRAVLVLLAGALASAACASPSEEADAATSDLVGGTRAAPNQFPSTLRIYGTCTATKVGPRHILTAAHCVADDSGFAPRAEYLPGKAIVVVSSVEGDSSTEGRAVKIAKTWIHPAHRPLGSSLAANADTDVALIELDGTWYDTLADVPAAAVDITTVAENDPVVIMGYGCEAAGSDRQGPLKFQRTRVATDALRALGVSGIAGEEVSFFFSRGATFPGEAGGCQGDSGGPVYRDGTNLVVGVLSVAPADRRSTGHARLDVASRFDVGSWLASIPGVQIQGAPSDHYDACTDPGMLVCGAVAKAQQLAGEASFGAPKSLPSRVVRPDGTSVWRQEFVKKRVTIEPVGTVVVVDQAEAHCEDVANGVFCGVAFGDDEPRALDTCADHVLVSRVVCASACGLDLDANGSLSMGCQSADQK